MFRSRSWFGTGWGRPKNPHSLEHLKYLYNVLSRNQTVSEHNRGLLVESLRCIAEILIWGDQNDSSVFDFFLEKNMLSFFLRIMRQRSGGSSFVCVQLLQTLNILFENIRNETSLYYLLSNNHVNSIIVHKFDFSDEEVMAYYISFLKTLSLKLNAHTIHFFYNEHTNDFPLYTEAIKFFNHPESMVRIAVRTLTLNVYKVEDASMLAFIRDRTAAPYFSNIVWFIGKHIHELDTCVRNDADHLSQNRLADLVAEHLDHLHYLNDILCLKIPDVNQVLTEHLLHKLLIPMYIYSLNSSAMHIQENSIETAAQNLAKILNRKVNLPEVASEKEPSNGKVSCVVALFLLSQVFLIISHAPLIETLSWIILRTNRVQFEKGVGKLLELYESEYQKGNFNPPPIQQDNGASSSSANAGLSRSSSPGTAARISCEPHLNNSTCIARTNSDSDSGASTNVGTTVCNGSIPNTDRNITDEEKQMQLTTDGSGSSTEAGSVSRTSGGNNEQHQNHADKPFLMVVLSALDCTENDYSALFALSLLYAMANNKGVRPDLLERILRPKKSVSRSSQPSTSITPSTSSTSSATVKDVKYTYNQHVVDQLLQIVMHACQPSCRVRLVTLELALRLLVQVVTCDGKNILTEAHRVCIENARAQSVALLRNFYKSEEIFLDMFEHEYCDMSKTSLNVEWLCMDSAILLPPTGTPLTGIDFTKRLPCGEVERARRAIRVFFLVRDTVLTLQSDVETQLPLTNPQSCVHIDQALDLNNSDLLACTVLWKDGTKMRRFLVIDVMQLILVEPDTKKLGWGVAKLVGFLQDIEVSGDKDDSRCLHITIQKPLGSCGVGTGSTGSGGNRTPLLSARFMFDDNIRCMAAKQRLTKGRMKVRQKKMQHIARLLEIPGQSGPPSPAYMGAAMGVGNRNTSISGRGIVYREARSLFGGSMAGGHAVGIGGIGGSGRLVALPGFAAPRRDSNPGILHRADAANMRRRRDSDSPSRIAMANAKGGTGSGSSTPVNISGTTAVSSVGSGNGIGAKMRSRDSSANRSKSRDTSPRMPRPRSEEIPLELIKKSSPENSILIPDASSKISIIPRPQTPVMAAETEPETVALKPDQLHQTQEDEQEQQLEVASITSEETSFIGEMSPKKKASIETV